MEKNHIEFKDREFRDKLKELRMNLAIRQVEAEQMDSKPRNHLKVVVPFVLIFALAFYFVGKSMTDDQPVASSDASYQSNIKEQGHSFPSDQAISEETLKTNGSSLPPDTLIADSTDEKADSDTLIGNSTEEKFDSDTLISATMDNKQEYALDNDLATNHEITPEPAAKTALTDQEINQQNKKTTLTDIPDKAGDMTAAPAENTEIKTDPSVSSHDVSSSVHGIRIAQHLVCSGVKDRNCISEQSVFGLENNQNPHVWMEVYSDSLPVTLKHVYYHEGQKYVEVSLKIEYRRTRTWSYVTLKNTTLIGSWHVEIVTEDDTLLGRVDFKVTD